MSPEQAQNRLKEQMWTRLSSSRDALDLDDRIEEEPEDLFVQMADGDGRDQVVSSLNALLVVELAGGPSSPLDESLRFLKRALRLCDALGAEDFKGVLRLLLCEDNGGSRWGNDLSELQELAARALSGVNMSRDDLQFWSNVAHKHTGATPYALNALLEIDLAKGLEQFCSVRLAWFPTGQNPEPDWETILQMAVSRYGMQEFAKHLETVCNRLRGPKTSREYLDEFAELAGIPPLIDPPERLELRLISYSKLGDPGRLSPDTQEIYDVLNWSPGSSSPNVVTIQSTNDFLRSYETITKPIKVTGTGSSTSQQMRLQYTS